MTPNKIVNGVTVPLTDAEIAERQAEHAAWLAAEFDHRSTAVRAERDRLLAASDWTQVADTPVSQVAWATYRQALRDVPQQAGFPHDVTWPSKPE
jgi:hypothetical protein